MGKLKTIKVNHKTYKIQMLINEKDFDSSIHERLDKKTSGKVNKKDFKVLKKDGNYVIVNKNNQQVDPSSYTSEADANFAIQLLMAGE